VWADDLAAELERSDDLLRLEDAAAAAEWTRTELAAWRESRGMPQDAYFDGADRGTRLVIDSRGAVGSCLIAGGRPADAVRVLAPCVGADAIFHSACGEPLLEAGGKLVEQGRYRDAGAAYAALAPVRNFAYRAEDIRRAIEKAAPGTVRPFEPSPTATPAVSPTPGPTPRLPPA
jgi:hypothetical protein